MIRHHPLIVVAALAAALATTVSGCGSVSMPVATELASLTVSFFDEERLVAESCAIVRAKKGDGTDKLLSDRGAKAATAIDVETTLQLSAMFEATRATSRCDATALLRGTGDPDRCIEEIRKGAPGALRGVLEAGETLALLKDDPRAFAQRFDLGVPLMRAGVRIADGADELAQKIAEQVPYGEPLVDAFLRQVAAELVAVGFEQGLSQLAKERFIGPAQLARASCAELEKKQGLAATRLLRRAVLRFRPAASKQQAAGNAKGALPSDTWPIDEGCKAVESMAARSGRTRQWPSRPWKPAVEDIGCSGLWKAAHTGETDTWTFSATTPKAPKPLNPKDQAATTSGLAAVLEKAAATCAEMTCGPERFTEVAGLIAAFGDPKTKAAPSPAEVEGWGRALRAGVGGDEAAQASDDPGLGSILERQVELDKKLDGLQATLERLLTCSDLRERVTQARFEALKRTFPETLVAATTLDSVCREDKPFLDLSDAKASFQIRIKRDILCKSGSPNFDLEASGPLFELSDYKVPDARKAELDALFEKLEKLIAALTELAAQDKGKVADLVVLGQEDENPCKAGMPAGECDKTHDRMIKARASEVVRVYNDPSRPKKDHLLVKASEDTGPGRLPLHKHPCREETKSTSSPAFLACTKRYRGILLRVNLEGWYPCQLR